MWILAPPLPLWILKEHSSLHYPPCISSTQIAIHLWLRVGEGAPLKESSGGRADSICSDTYGFLAWLNTPDKSLPPKLSPTASTFLPLFFAPQPHRAKSEANRTLIHPSSSLRRRTATSISLRLGMKRTPERQPHSTFHNTQGQKYNGIFHRIQLHFLHALTNMFSVCFLLHM